MSSLHAEYLEQEEEKRLEDLEQQQAQEEAHKHFVTQEFSAYVISDGAATMLGQMDKEAAADIRQVVLRDYYNMYIFK